MNKYLITKYTSPHYLAHHGILGMKWGIRRYQNPDGSLTEEGRLRLGQMRNTLTRHVNKDSEKMNKKFDQNIRNALKNGDNVQSKYWEEQKKSANEKVSQILKKISNTNINDLRTYEYERDKKIIVAGLAGIGLGATAIALLTPIGGAIASAASSKIASDAAIKTGLQMALNIGTGSAGKNLIGIGKAAVIFGSAPIQNMIAAETAVNTALSTSTGKLAGTVIGIGAGTAFTKYIHKYGLDAGLNDANSFDSQYANQLSETLTDRNRGHN